MRLALSILGTEVLAIDTRRSNDGAPDYTSTPVGFAAPHEDPRWEKGAAAMSDTTEVGRPLEGRELRRFERKSARRYMHAHQAYRHCQGASCWRCHWKRLTGGHRREKRRMVERARAIKPYLRPVGQDGRGGYTPMRGPTQADGRWDA